MRQLMKRMAVMSLIGLPIVGIAVPAGASTSTHNVQFVVAKASTHPDKVLNSKIVGNGKVAVYKPDTLTVPEDTTGGNCRSGFVSFVMINQGTTNAYVTVFSHPSFTLAAGEKYDICFTGGSADGQFTFGLSNKKNTKEYKATLVITYSD